MSEETIKLAEKYLTEEIFESGVDYGAATPRLIETLANAIDQYTINYVLKKCGEEREFALRKAIRIRWSDGSCRIRRLPREAVDALARSLHLPPPFIQPELEADGSAPMSNQRKKPLKKKTKPCVCGHTQEAHLGSKYKCAINLLECECVTYMPLNKTNPND